MFNGFTKVSARVLHRTCNNSADEQSWVDFPTSTALREADVWHTLDHTAPGRLQVASWRESERARVSHRELMERRWKRSLWFLALLELSRDYTIGFSTYYQPFAIELPNVDRSLLVGQNPNDIRWGGLLQPMIRGHGRELDRELGAATRVRGYYWECTESVGHTPRVELTSLYAYYAS